MNFQDASRAWFALHPFWRNELVMVATALAALWKLDRDEFKKFLLHDSTATWKWSIALPRYAVAAYVAGIPPFIAAFWNIIGQ